MQVFLEGCQRHVFGFVLPEGKALKQAGVIAQVRWWPQAA